jgi:hypothetical protein
MDTTLAQMTKQEFQELMETTIDQKLLSWFNLLETRLTTPSPKAIQPIAITPPSLKPLPVLPGYVPQGWKEAIYHAQE